MEPPSPASATVSAAEAISLIDLRRRESLEAFVKEGAFRLGREFDAVQVIATARVGGTTWMFSSGEGNHFARKAMVEQFVRGTPA